MRFWRSIMTARGAQLAGLLSIAVLLVASGVACSAGDGPADESAGAAASDGAGASGETEVLDRTEVHEYQGLPLDTYFRTYDNSIRGPQTVDLDEYTLRIEGLVDQRVELTYDEVLALPAEERGITLYCVEGWAERLLFEGVRVADLLALAGVQDGATTIIFHALDDYTTSVPFEDVERLDLMLAAKVNGRVLDETRGFPFQLVAQSKLGYKWIKWIDRIELTDEPFAGFWESRGYSNAAEVPDEWQERTMRKAPR